MTEIDSVSKIIVKTTINQENMELKTFLKKFAALNKAPLN